jgi:hypothetical protein
LLKEGVHNLQNVSSTTKEVKNLGNKQMATRTPTQVQSKILFSLFHATCLFLEVVGRLRTNACPD